MKPRTIHTEKSPVYKVRHGEEWRTLQKVWVTHDRFDNENEDDKLSVCIGTSSNYVHFAPSHLFFLACAAWFSKFDISALKRKAFRLVAKMLTQVGC